MPQPTKSALFVDGRNTLRTTFDGIVGYHNTLLQTRFTVAGLYLAATGFLASSWFASSGHRHSDTYWLIPGLGCVLTLICWTLEIRNAQMLRNVQTWGERIESELGVKPDVAFFALMHSQPEGSRFPFTSVELPEWKLSKHIRIVSHSVGLNALYASILLFWFLIAWLG